MFQQGVSTEMLAFISPLLLISSTTIKKKSILNCNMTRFTDPYLIHGVKLGNPLLNMEHNNTTCNASCFCEELSRFKDFAKLSGCFSPLVFVFQLLIGVNPTTVFPVLYSQPWMIHILSRFVMQNFHFRLAFIEHSCSSWLYRDSQHVSAPKRMENMREYRKKRTK